MAATCKVILLKGDKKNPESGQHIIKFPGGYIELTRTTDDEYWAHIGVNKKQILEDDVVQAKRGFVVDSRIDYTNGNILDMINFPDIQNIAVRIRTE